MSPQLEAILSSITEYVRSLEGAFTTTTMEVTTEPLNDTYEYKVIKTDRLQPEKLEEVLDELGADGWDMVGYDGRTAILSRFCEEDGEG